MRTTTSWRRGTSVVLPGAPPNLDGLPGSDLAGIAITRQSAQSTTLCIQPDAPPAAIDRLCERLPANQRQPVRDAYRQAVALRCPAERGETLTLPLLAWRQGELILGEATAEELRHHGRFSARDCPPHDCDWSNDRQATTSEIDADAAGHLGISDARIRQLSQRALGEQWDRDWLVYWLRNLDRHPRSFRLPCPSAHGDWFYPDFLGRLTDTRLLVMEYKGGYLEPFDSRKRQMGPGLAAGNERARRVPVDRRFGRDVAGAQHRATDTGGVARGLGCAHHAVRPPRAAVWWLTMAR